MMENTAECTYPIPEELSMGILFVGANILGLGFIFALQFLLDADRLGPPPLLPSNIFILCEYSSALYIACLTSFSVIMALALVILQFYQGQYKRLQHEGAHSDPLLGADGSDEESTKTPLGALSSNSI